MSQTVITLAFEHWKTQQAINNSAVVLDEFVLANVPNLDVESPIDRAEQLPAVKYIVHRQAVSAAGLVNENSVVYSVTMGADVGDFEFNWVGLTNKATGTLAMIVHAPLQSKIKNADGKQGNVLTRSFLMEYNGAASETQITTPAETWQIDFTARLAGMDERQRLENVDIYGAAAFFGDGFLVTRQVSQYSITQGIGYVGGLRCQLPATQNITVTTKPVKVWADVCWKGTLTSVWDAVLKITVADKQANYVQDGVQHYVFAVASIDANGVITDLRPKGALSDQQAHDALKEHEQSRNHPDGTVNARGFVQLSSATNSSSETLAATPKAVKAAYDLANGKYTAQDATTTQKGIVQLNNATNSTSEAQAATPKAVKAAYDLANGKYTAQDATTTQKGIVQLNSATNSESETQAATPKAVKAANDNANGRVPSGRKVNGHALSSDTSVTSVDIFDGQAVGLGANQNLNNLKIPGIYYQSLNANASLALNYPEALAGSLLIYKSAGITQVYRVYNSSRIYSRSQYGDEDWTPWAKEYNSLNKPTASDIDAVSISDIVQASGASKSKVMSQDACTRLFADSASYSIAGSEPQIKVPSGSYLFLSTGGYAGVKNKSGSTLWQFDPSGVLVDGTVPVARVSGLQQIGIGQSWQNVKSQRTFGATYTNTTGKPIVVSVSVILDENTNSVLTLSVGGVDVISSAVTRATFPVRGNVTAIVPPSTAYRVNGVSMSLLQQWAELR
ncbi:MAG: tail fiber protein [Hafnia alvei]|uniref:tail fiber protein n=1 Tax=Hafnia alvei TaxID=569 RepID=UPI003F905E30